MVTSAHEAPQLRPYQHQAVESVLAKIDEHPRAYIAMPTGSGKSVVLASIAKHMLKRGRVLVVAHRVEIVAQLAVALRNVTGESVATLAEGKLSDPDAPALVAMVQSLTLSRLQAWLDRGPVAALFIDEAHHVESKNNYARIVEAFGATHPGAIILGATATPFRLGKGRMQDVLSRCLVSKTIDDMIALDVLAKLTSVAIKLPLGLAELRTIKGDYEQRELSARMLRVTRETVARTLPHIAGRRTIVFAVSCDHAQELSLAYSEAGASAFYVDGKTPKAERAASIAAWRSKSAAVLVNVGVATEGFDEPTVSAVVIAAPTQSPGLYLQRVGRGTRKSAGKTDCLVVDVTGSKAPDERQALFANVFVSGPIGDGQAGEQQPGPRGFLASPIEDDKNGWIEPKPGLYALSIGRGCFWLAWRDPVSGLWAARLRNFAGRVVQRFDDEVLPELTELIGASVREMGANPLTSKNARWRRDRASDAQLQKLEQLGVILDDPLGWTAGKASALIARTMIGRSIARHGVGSNG